ncbi:MAG: hypothetical protein JXB49_14305 [Bacteroidales bacterium]|nr:hypothetical protein [Bacteroidales bacterium]
MEKRAEFTVEDGIKVQTKQLERWAKVLKPEVFEDLRSFAIINNDKAHDGYGITRGCDLEYFILNYQYSVTN